MRPSLHEVRIERLVDVGRVDIVPGFFAITRSPQLREMLARVLDLGAVVTAAVHRSLLIGYAADLPFLPIVLEHGEWKRRWQLLPDVRELGGIEVARPFRGSGIARLLLELPRRCGRARQRSRHHPGGAVAALLGTSLRRRRLEDRRRSEGE